MKSKAVSNIIDELSSFKSSGVDSLLSTWQDTINNKRFPEMVGVSSVEKKTLKHLNTIMLY